MFRPALLAALLVTAVTGHAQSGDKPGEVQALLVPRDQIPPAPVLTPEEALKTLRLPPGLRAELVAAEPLLHTPVAAAWDEEGRLWVCEMRGYMNDYEAASEKVPDGEIAVLEDTDGDGRMDRRTTFLAGLLMPRALAIAHGGVLVAEPPNLWFCRDTDGDLKCDEKQLVSGSYGNQNNPEHNANGLLRALDNWYYSANHTNRHRLDAGRWLTGATIQRGQWGLSQDDAGRLIYNSNSDWLRGDLVPAERLLRNPHLNRPAGGNVQLAKDQSVWPSRVTPGINRGYQQAMLRDGRLATFTAACGTAVYRGDALPSEFRGDVFVCEPSAHLVRRGFLAEDPRGVLTGRNAYERGEFLTSTDERFRPVNAYTGPDGALHVVDMARGLIQHRIYLTSYLRGQIEERGLLEPLARGRIYRIVPEGWRPPPPVRLGRATAAELVAALGHANGWVRDTAQRLLVERAPADAAGALRDLTLSPAAGPAALHALWTLEGLGELDEATVRAAVRSQDPRLRQHALRAAASLPAGRLGALGEVLVAATADADPRVRREALFTGGLLAGGLPVDTLLAAVARDGEDALTRDAVLAGLAGREAEILAAALARPNWAAPVAGRRAFLAAAVQCVLRSRAAGAAEQLLALAAAAPPAWARAELLQTLAAAVPQGGPGRPAPAVKPIPLPTPPPLFAEPPSDPAAREPWERAGRLFTWPGKPPGVEAAPAAPLSAEEQDWFHAGRELYPAVCGACHQPHGLGQDGLAPPLVGTEWVTGSEERLVRLVLHGMRGPVRVGDRVWELEMPALNVLEDAQIAGLLTYIRREWENAAAPVSPATVARIRAATAQRSEAWTEAELLRIP
jgi:mono/diheme cytochrome c family protein/glucose/arabinose dehydrogenase